MKKLEELGISKLPWGLTSRRLPYPNFGEVIDPEGYWVAEASGEDDEQMDANARLIAAAPEVYDAAERVIRYHDMSCVEGDCTFREVIAEYQTALADLRKALAKAAGEEEAK